MEWSLDFFVKKEKTPSFFCAKHRKMVPWDVAVASLQRALEYPTKNQDNQKDPEFVLPQELEKHQKRSHAEPKDEDDCRKTNREDEPGFCKPFDEPHKFSPFRLIII